MPTIIRCRKCGHKSPLPTALPATCPNCGKVFRPVRRVEQPRLNDSSPQSNEKSDFKPVASPKAFAPIPGITLAGEQGTSNAENTNPVLSGEPATAVVPDRGAGNDPDTKGFRGILYKGIALAMLIGGLWSLQRDYAFVWSSTSVPGVLTATPTSHIVGSRKTRHTEFNVQYTFSVGGRGYSGRDSIRSAPSARSITVYYERANPSNSRAELPETWVGWALSIMGALMTLTFFDAWKLFAIRDFRALTVKTAGWATMGVVKIIENIIPVLGIIFFGSFLLCIGAKCLSFFVWCLPFPVALLAAFVTAMIMPRRAKEGSAYFCGVIASLGAIACYPWAAFVLVQNLRSLPNWLLILLSVPLHPDVPQMDDRGHWQDGFGLPDMLGLVLGLSGFGVIGLIGVLWEWYKHSTAKPRKTVSGVDS